MMRSIAIIFIFLTFLSGCTTSKTMKNPSESILQTQEVYKSEGELKFNVSSFKMSYEDESTKEHFDEKYSGEGIITVNGNDAVLKRTFFVFVDVAKISGGASYGNSEIKTVIVNNGIGKFNTHDWNYKKSEKMVKPIYEAKIIGYIQAVDYQTEIVKTK